MFRLLRRATSALAVRGKFLRPYELKSGPLAIREVPAPAPLQMKDTSVLVKQWWSQTPFPENQPLLLPIVSFSDGSYTGRSVELDPSIFNVPLRRDVVHNAFWWRERLFKKTTHITRTVGMVAASGKKPHPQKKTGKARMGKKRAPGRWKGGKAHGAKPRDFSFNQPRKLRLLAMRVALTAVLTEGRLLVVDSEAVDTPKTKVVAKAISVHGRKAPTLFIPGFTPDANFVRGAQNLPDVEVCRPERVNLPKLLRSKRIIVTLEGLSALTQVLRERTYARYRLRSMPRTQMSYEVSQAKKEETAPVYDPSKPLQFKFKLLEEYHKEYERLRAANAPIEPVRLRRPLTPGEKRESS
eukprot:TRINITY_DN212_c0_g1_i1.p1 TRINITY_DN212_c0_g1~~TRINITY_DN212_c0_g1_i1.p1  ORF type:complete len:354 (-),score=76.60 TRINITY_DN212_c0_g1_i1:658-1719(-)